ncbi:MAG: DUF1302 domain-containing protein [Pseudomonadales bacterium]|nr:DUF1302 domain-containing protein [Pseudomonadales bacterium]
MTRKTNQWNNLRKLPLAAAIAATVSAAPVSAFQFFLGDDIEGAFDTTLSAGASWRVADRDKDQLSQGNLGPEFAYSGVGGSSNNYDDGNWNFDQGDTYSKIIKGNSELLLTYENFGGFVRGKYWYDFELKDEKRATDGVGQRRQLNDHADKNASGAELLDAYVWGDFQIGETPLSLRLGKQVVSWGESTFIQNGISVINPVDVSAIRAPGAEIKEAFIPVNMVYTSLGITENLSMEAFAQLEWEKTRPDDCGTFFSGNDFAPDDCGPVLLAGQLPDSIVYQQGAFAPRVGDDEPDDGDQYGIAFRYYAAELNDTEFGLYYIRYHSRTPYSSGIVNNPSSPNAALGQANDPDQAFSSFPSYFIEYPEGIHLYGLSFNTSLESGWSLSGEYSFRANLPVQWNAFELIYGGLQLPYSKMFQKYNPDGQTNLAGQKLPGYDRYKVSQAQFTLIRFFDQVFGASRMTVVSEFGATYVHDLPGKDEARYGRSGHMGFGEFDYQLGSLSLNCKTSPQVSPVPTNINPNHCTNDGFTTGFSWGYRARIVLDYNDVFAGINMQPQLAWSHDVVGYSPEPGPSFVEGRKAIGLSLKAVYLNQYSATLGYTNFFGGEPYNMANDRDNVSLSVSYSF